ncbi:MAG TPA: DUF2269 family protein [Chitinophagaceae bacterium]|nr:DUF2269 family protein [Chitinophagaceae bacterium]
MNYYLILKAIHLLAVVAFLGNIVTGLFWMKFARKTNDIKIIHHTAAGIIASDKLFTIPGVIIITAAGFSSAIYGGIKLLRTGWIFWPIILFSLSGLFFAFKVAPLQGKMSKYLVTDTLDKTNPLEQFDRLLRQWEFWGLLALLTPVISFLMMILKWPALSPLAH